MNFEWNADKAQINLIRHQIGFKEASTVFDDIYAKWDFDPDHSNTEDRFIIIGYSNKNRLLFVSYTERNERIRIISARAATRNERYQYENKN
jgi:uncharacterized protein